MNLNLGGARPGFDRTGFEKVISDSDWSSDELLAGCSAGCSVSCSVGCSSEAFLSLSTSWVLSCMLALVIFFAFLFLGL